MLLLQSEGCGRLLFFQRTNLCTFSLHVAAASSRNEGLIVMGRYFAMGRDTVRIHLARVRTELTPTQRDKPAEQFAAAYAHSAYRNAALIEQTIREEGFDCDCARNGWIQTRDEADQPALHESVAAGERAGFDDWTSLPPEQVLEKGGMVVDAPAGFSQRAACFHPAKWVWSLLERALKNGDVELFTRTRVLRVEDEGEGHCAYTTRGSIAARCIINAIESHTAALHLYFDGRGRSPGYSGSSEETAWIEDWVRDSAHFDRLKVSFLPCLADRGNPRQEDGPDSPSLLSGPSQPGRIRTSVADGRSTVRPRNRGEIRNAITRTGA